ncbi:MAG: hypothetical protein J5658_03735 [Prevotella sp.]|nr:hypothetical protein [Prevotella sp.]
MKWIQRLIAKIGIDKFAHFFASAFLALALGHFIHPAIAAATALLIGVAKELFDGVIDKGDLLADALGVALGIVIAIL